MAGLIGKAPNQVPLNQHLSPNAFTEIASVKNGGTGTQTLTGVVKGNGTAPMTAGDVDLETEVVGTLPIANGGTGQTTATGAINALLPAQSGNNNKSLLTNGASAFWGTPAAAGGGTGQLPVILADTTSDAIDITANAALTTLSVSDSLTLGKTMDVYVGDLVVGWKDLLGQIQLRGKTTDPTWTQIGTSPFWGFKTAIGNKIWLFFHINHDYKPGGDILLHVHWTSAGTDTTNAVAFRFDYTVAKGHNQASGGTFNIGSPTTVTIAQASGAQYRHMVTEMETTIDVTNAEPDSVIWVQVERVTNGATDNTDDIYLLLVDCHYQMSRFATPQKAPDFYA